MERLTPEGAERTRSLIEWVFLIGALGTGFASLLTTSPALASIALAFCVALLVFEAAILVVAQWWFG